MNKEACLIIIGEGGIPSDFPKGDLYEFLNLKSKILSSLYLNEDERKRFEELKIKLNTWNRNFRNDEYYHALIDLSNFITLNYKIRTFYSFLDYCEPDLINSIENAINSNYNKIYILSTKFILKKEEALKIKDEINFMKIKYKNVEIINLTDLNFDDISKFMIDIIKKKEDKEI